MPEPSYVKWLFLFALSFWTYVSRKVLSLTDLHVDSPLAHNKTRELTSIEHMVGDVMGYKL